MNDPIRLAKIKETNGRYFGMSEIQMVENAGEGLANEILHFIQKNPDIKSISCVCGLGNNGADGMAAVKSLLGLLKEKIVIKVYLIGRSQDLKTEAAQTEFYNLKQLEKQIPEFELVQDAYAKDISSADLIIEALLGVGVKGIIRKRFKDVIDKVARLHSYKIAIDVPVQGYKANLVLSLITPKRKDAKVIDLHLPKEVDEYVGPGHIKFLYTPPKDTYKSKNGELLVVGGSELFHGAPIMAIKAASKFIGSVFFYTHPVNRELVSKQKAQLEEFISLKENDLERFANYADVILVGPGLEDNLPNKALITHLLNTYTEKTFVLDAYAINMANPARNKLNKRGFRNCILTPHRGELRHIFDETKMAGLEGKLRDYCVKNKCITVLKGSIDLLFNSDGTVLMDKAGNPGMAKGGSGDVLSGIIGALACKNPPWEAAVAGTFLSGKAGDFAYKKYGYNFSATDVIPYLQEVYKWALEF